MLARLCANSLISKWDLDFPPWDDCSPRAPLDRPVSARIDCIADQ
jgi:hypothetical protein